MQKTLHTGELRSKKKFTVIFLYRYKNLIFEIVAALHLLLFIYTGVNKFLALDDLRFVLKQYPLIGSFPEIIAWGVPLIELLVAGLLFVPKTKKLGLTLSAALMSVFTAYIVYMIIYVPKLPCTCGGMLQTLSWTQHIIFNLSFLFLAIVALRFYKKTELRKRNYL
jgi:hypothetical protein